MSTGCSNTSINLYLYINTFLNDFLLKSEVALHHLISGYMSNFGYYLRLFHRFSEITFLIVGDKSKYNNIYTDLLRHNFIYGESKI